MWWALLTQLLPPPPLPPLPPPPTARATTSTAKRTAPTAPSCRRRTSPTTTRRRRESPRPRRTSACRNSCRWVQGPRTQRTSSKLIVCIKSSYFWHISCSFATSSGIKLLNMHLKCKGLLAVWLLSLFMVNHSLGKLSYIPALIWTYGRTHNTHVCIGFNLICEM